MGCCGSVSEKDRQIGCLVYGQQRAFHIEDVVTAVNGTNGCQLQPKLRAFFMKGGSPDAIFNCLEFAHMWTPVAEGSCFAVGSGPLESKAAKDLLNAFLLAKEIIDGREEVLYAARADVSIDDKKLPGPTILTVTSLGVIGVIRLSGACSSARWLAHFHIHQLQALACNSTTVGELKFASSQHAPQKVCGKEAIGGASGGRLQVTTETAALAELAAVIQLLHSVIGRQNVNIVKNQSWLEMVPELAQAVKPFWKPPQPPLDAGFAAAFAVCSAARGKTVRNEPKLSLGARYFGSVPLLQLNLTDVGPIVSKTVDAAAQAWKGNTYFRTFTLNRKPSQEEFQAYIAGICESPLLEIDLASAQLEAEQLQGLTQAISSNPYCSIFALNLSGTSLAAVNGDNFAKGIDAALPPPTAHSFRALRLAGCSLAATDNGGAAVLALISRRSSRLEVLDLSQNKLCGDIHPALSALNVMWNSAALREVKFAYCAIPIAAILPSPDAAVHRRPVLKLDVSGCAMDDQADALLAPILSQVKDLRVTASSMTTISSKGLAASLLATTSSVVPRRLVQLDLEDSPPSQVIKNASSKLSANVLIKLGYSDAQVKAQRPHEKVGEFSSIMEAFNGCTVGSMVIHNMMVESPDTLANILMAAQDCCLPSWDPKQVGAYGQAALQALGVELPAPQSSEGGVVQMATVMVQVPPGCLPGQTIQFQTASGPMNAVIPEGISEGQSFQVQAPVTDSTTNQPSGSLPDNSGPFAQAVSVSPLKEQADRLRRMLESNSDVGSLALTGYASLSGSSLPVSVLPAGSDKTNLPISDPFCGGPMLARGLQGLAVNKTLLELDVSFNCMGDVGAITLGRALRKNRTLKSLNMDGNFITVAGWASFRGCLYGNKKLTNFTFPERDVQWLTSHFGSVISKNNQVVVQAKATIKRAFKSTKGQRTQYVLSTRDQQVEIIRFAKRQIGSSERLTAKMHEIQKQIQEDVSRNQQVWGSSIAAEKAARPLWAEARVVLKRMEANEKKRKLASAAANEATWKLRNQVWNAWEQKAAKLLAKKHDVGWWERLVEQKSKDSNNSAGQKCLKDDEAKKLLASIPSDLEADCNPEIQKTKSMLEKEKEKQSKLTGQVVLLESDKLEMQALLSDPAWRDPPQESYADVLSGLAMFKLMGAMNQNQAAENPVLIKPPAQLVMVQAVVIQQPDTSGAGPKTSSSASPTQQQVQYDMLQLHQQKVQNQQVQQQNPQKQQSGAHRSKFQQSRSNSRRDDDYHAGGAAGGLWYASNNASYNHRVSPRYDDDHYHDDSSYSYYNDDDAFATNDFDEPPPNFEPANVEQLDEDVGDAPALEYGAGGEEPPLPDGGNDEPRENAALRSSGSSKLLPVCFHPVRWRGGARLAEASPAALQPNAQKSLWRAEEVALQEWLGTMHEDLPYLKERDVLGTRQAALAGGHGVCLATQCSVDRLERLRAQCVAWAPGICSAAIFVSGAECRSTVLDTLANIHKECAVVGGFLVASIVHALPTVKQPYDALYPPNALRNVAMEEATSDLVLVLDVDFLPSRDLHETLEAFPGGLRSFLAPVGGMPRALVVPAFEAKTFQESSVAGSPEATQHLELPRDFGALSECGDRASAFHSTHFSMGHRATDFEHWKSLVQLSACVQPWAYDISYEEYFEPYVVVSRTHAPRFDERFRGYGLNKCSFLRHCHALGFNFSVLVKGAHFVVAAEHPRSSSWGHVYGKEADPAEALKLALVWRLFLRSLPPAIAVSTQKRNSNNSDRDHRHQYDQNHDHKSSRRMAQSAGAFRSGMRRAPRSRRPSSRTAWSYCAAVHADSRDAEDSEVYR